MDVLSGGVFKDTIDLFLAFILPMVSLLFLSARNPLKTSEDNLRLFIFYLSIIMVMFVAFFVGMLEHDNSVIRCIGFSMCMLIGIFSGMSTIKPASWCGGIGGY
ncbi:hypothetical protein HON59_02655 [bacterium]|nr:hypothetical protein [bacterium]MBT3730062.1 hypothetical protein [bacterium]MBT4894932.1 hypothetical protein [bacterium]